MLEPNENWYNRPLFKVIDNFFTKEHPPSGYWPTWQCVLRPILLSALFFFAIRHRDLFQIGISSFGIPTPKQLFLEIFSCLMFGILLTVPTLDIYALILRDKPERPWLFCLIAMSFWPVLFFFFLSIFSFSG